MFLRNDSPVSIGKTIYSVTTLPTGRYLPGLKKDVARMEDAAAAGLRQAMPHACGTRVDTISRGGALMDCVRTAYAPPQPLHHLRSPLQLRKALHASLMQVEDL